MSNEIDLTGYKFGKWKVLSHSLARKYSFICKCECGTIKDILTFTLKNGSSTQCGFCNNRTHNLTNHLLYGVWSNMKRRCFNLTSHNYKRYGGRGISVCDEWRNDFLSFYNWAISHGWSRGLQLDRIDNDGNYEPENCRFTSSAINTRNSTSTKLNNTTIKDIKFLLSNGIEGKTISALYHISRSNISLIKNNKAWRIA